MAEAKPKTETLEQRVERLELEAREVEASIRVLQGRAKLTEMKNAIRAARPAKA